MDNRIPKQKIAEVRTPNGWHGYDDMKLEESTKEELEELRVLAIEAIQLEIEKREFIGEIQDKIWERKGSYNFLTCEFDEFGEEECARSEESVGRLRQFISEIYEELTARNTPAKK